MGDVPEGIEKKLYEFQGIQQQLEMFANQKMQQKMQMDEVEGAVEALKTAKGKVYKSAGLVVVESDKETLQKELEERKEQLTMRAQVLAKQEDRVKKRFAELRAELEEASKGMNLQGGSPPRAGKGAGA